MSIKKTSSRANLRDVARAAQVSVATVSRVLNTPEKVRQDTRTRVETAISDLNFRRSAAARAINTGRTKILGALIPSLDSDIFAVTINSIERRLADFGFSLVVATTEDDREIEARKAKELLDIGVEGLFLTGITHNDDLTQLIKRASVPAVVISYFDANYHLPTIGYDNQDAARSACAHLVHLGHRRITFVHGPVDNNDRTRARLEGVMGFDGQVALSFVKTELSVGGGADAVPEVLAQDQAPDAILCASDILAFGVLHELQRRSFSVPDDMAVMGIHDLPTSGICAPRLCSVRLPAEDMGKKAAEALANWVENDQRPDALSLPTKVIVRETTQRNPNSDRL